MISRAGPLPHRWAVLGIIMIGTFMAILDSSIVNVALPHMMSAFGVNRDKVEWVSTGFLVASAVVMPFMGWLATRVSYKLLYLTSLLIFTVASAACAMAWNFESLVVARIFQALGGGAIQPIGMAIVAELFEPHERGRALGVWGTGIMVAPALGPTLGGYLTDAFSWRAIFSVNLPIGVLALVAGMIIMGPIRAHGDKRRFDFFGFGFLAMALIAGLTALSNGQDKGWDSTYIHVCEVFAVIGAVMFVAVELTVASPLLDLRLFVIRNYSLSVLLAIFRAVGLFGSVFLLPIFLQNLMGYTTVQAGLWMMPGAVAVGLTMPLAGRLADRYSPRMLTVVGCTLTGLSLIAFGDLDPRSGWAMLILPQLVRGAGLALMMAPLLAAALNAVPRHEMPMATGFLNVSQNVGGAMGIAILNNFVTNSVHTHAVRLGEAFPYESASYFRFSLDVSQMVFYHAQGILPTPQIKAAAAAGESMLPPGPGPRLRQRFRLRRPGHPLRHPAVPPAETLSAPSPRIGEGRREGRGPHPGRLTDFPSLVQRTKAERGRSVGVAGIRRRHQNGNDICPDGTADSACPDSGEAAPNPDISAAAWSRRSWLSSNAAVAASTESTGPSAEMNWLKSTTRRSLRERFNPMESSRPIFISAWAIAVSRASCGRTGFRSSASRFLQTRMTSSCMGSLAWDLGVATDISALTGCALTIEKPAPKTAEARECQPSLREW